MSLYKRGRVWHYDFTVKGERQRGTTGFTAKADAAEYVENLRRALILGTPSPREVCTIGQAADQWFASRAVHLKSATTIAQRIKIMLRHVGRHTPVNLIGPREIEAAIMGRRAERTRQGGLPSNATVNRDLIDTTLRPILGYAREIMEEPVRDISWGKLKLTEPPERTRAFTAEEIEAWRQALPEWHRPVFDFVRRYGVRLREAFFPPEAVDIATGRVTIRQRKNGREHTIPLLPADARDIAARVGRARKADLDTVWFKDEGGDLTPIHWRAFQSASRAALSSAKITDARPAHDLRHHAATELLRASGNLAAAKRLLGHESIASTMRYAHADDEDVLSALRHTQGTKRGTETQKSRRIKAVRKAHLGT